MGTGNGLRALHLIAQYTRAMQPLRPLVLVLKALLKVGKLAVQWVCLTQHRRMTRALSIPFCSHVYL